MSEGEAMPQQKLGVIAYGAFRSALPPGAPFFEELSPETQVAWAAVERSLIEDLTEILAKASLALKNASETLISIIELETPLRRALSSNSGACPKNEQE